MNNADIAFKDLLTDILSLGKTVSTRNSVCLRSLMLKYSFQSSPLLSLRRCYWKKALKEMEWFLSGSSNINDLDPSVHNWWKPWANEEGEIPNNYGAQFREFHGRDGPVDQIKALADGIEHHPFSRRNVITAWNTADMLSAKTPITNCHSTLIQSFVDPGTNELHIFMYQRSVDVMLGLSHNWIQHWAMLLWLAKKAGVNPGSLTWMGGDCHIYEEHIEVARKIVTDSESWESGNAQLVYWGDGQGDFKASDFTLEGIYTNMNTDPLQMIV